MQTTITAPAKEKQQQTRDRLKKAPKLPLRARKAGSHVRPQA